MTRDSLRHYLNFNGNLGMNQLGRIFNRQEQVPKNEVKIERTTSDKSSEAEIPPKKVRLENQEEKEEQM